MAATTLEWKVADDSDLPSRTALTCEKWLQPRQPSRTAGAIESKAARVILERRQQVNSWLMRSLHDRADRPRSRATAPIAADAAVEA